MVGYFTYYIIFGVVKFDMKQYGSGRIYGIAVRIFVILTAVIFLFPGNDAQAADAYGLYVSDLAADPAAKHAELSEGVSNIIKRGRQMYEIVWTAQGEIASYPGTGEELFFREGVTYRGIPYGQPVHKGKYVGFNATIDEFAAAAADPASEMYTTRGENTWYYTEGLGDIKYAPFYSSDCSAFISYVWELSGRYTTSMIAKETKRKNESGYEEAKFQYVGDKLKDLRVGYALNKGSSHIILIYDIVYDGNGQILQVTTLEQTPPIMRLRVWGAGGNAGSLQDLQNMITDAPYDIIRYRDMENVTFTESAAVPLDAERYINRISEPISGSETDGAVSGSAVRGSGNLPLEGWTYHKNGVSAVEYRVNGADWQSASTEGCGAVVKFRGELQLAERGMYSVEVRGMSSGEYFAIANFSVEIGGTKAQYSVYFDNISILSELGSGDAPVEVSLQLENAKKRPFQFSGWAVSSAGVKGYEYKIDDGLWIPLEAGFRSDVYRSLKAYQKTCNVYNNFRGGMGFSHLPESETYTVSIRGITDSNDVFEIARIAVSLQAKTYHIFGLSLTRSAILSITIGLAAVLAAVVVTIVVVKKKHKKQVKTQSADETAAAAEIGTEEE